jgi:act minimal PKS chain-length factor (CLF/KS beta)
MSVDAVVTGIGVVAPNGVGLADYWAATLEGRSGIRRLVRFDPSRYPAALAGEVCGFDPAELLPSRLVPQTDISTRLSLVAAEWALRDAEVDLASVPELDRGVVTASTSGGYEFGQRELENLWRDGSQHVSAYQSFAWFYAVNTGQIGIRHRMRGPSGVLVSDHAGALDAVAQARRNLRQGAALMVAGGVDSSLPPWGWLGHLASGAMSTVDDPARAYLPFDADASGYVPGEGGAILIVETPAAVRARGLRRGYGYIAGYGATFDPRPGSGAPGNLATAIRLAIDDAGLRPGDIGAVFADAAGLPAADRAESDALREVFGAGGVPVSAPKTMTGRLCAGGAALDLATALLSIRDGVVPPTVNVRQLATGIDIDIVLEPRRCRLDHVLVVARGRGGFNAAMVVSRVPAGLLG